MANVKRYTRDWQKRTKRPKSRSKKQTTNELNGRKVRESEPIKTIEIPTNNESILSKLGICCIEGSKKRLICCKTFFSSFHSLIAYLQQFRFVSPRLLPILDGFLFIFIVPIYISMILFLIEIAIFILPSANCIKRMSKQLRAVLFLLRCEL